MKSLVVGAGLVALLVGCSPALNWRTVMFDAAALGTTFPCKPDQEARRVELAGQAVQMEMLGCEADGATFAVSHAVLPAGTAPAVALQHWQAAAAARAGATWPAATTPFVPKGALALPEAVRTTVQGQRPDGAAVTLQAAWFARVVGPEVHLYHAAFYSRTPRPEVADVFFNGLVLK